MLFLRGDSETGA